MKRIAIGCLLLLNLAASAAADSPAAPRVWQITLKTGQTQFPAAERIILTATLKNISKTAQGSFGPGPLIPLEDFSMTLDGYPVPMTLYGQDRRYREGHQSESHGSFSLFPPIEPGQILARGLSLTRLWDMTRVGTYHVTMTYANAAPQTLTVTVGEENQIGY